MDLVGSIIAYEGGDLDTRDTVKLFAGLIKSGDAWTLQGSYGRTAKAMIEAGVISEAGEIDDQVLMDMIDFSEDMQPCET